MSPNMLISGRYRLIDILDHGDTGSVWIAVDVALDHEVVVKEIRSAPIPPLISEARSSTRLRHPSVVTIHEVVEQDSRIWVVMDYVQARSLQEIIEREGPMPPGRAAEIGKQALEALEVGHREGVLHRAISPSKILVTPDNRVRLIGFGLAPLADTTSVARSGYAPPESVTDGPPEGPASDLWSLGATLYAAVEGHAPFERPTKTASLYALQHEAVGKPRNAGPLSRVLEGLLIREPAFRMTGAEALPLLARISTAPPLMPPDKDTPVVFRTGGDYEPVDWNLPVSRTKQHRYDSHVLTTFIRTPEPAQPDPPEEHRSIWQAFAEGFGGIFSIGGGREREPLPPFESTLADDVHELCLALSLIPNDERSRE